MPKCYAYEQFTLNHRLITIFTYISSSLTPQIGLMHSKKRYKDSLLSIVYNLPSLMGPKRDVPDLDPDSDTARTDCVQCRPRIHFIMQIANSINILDPSVKCKPNKIWLFKSTGLSVYGDIS